MGAPAPAFAVDPVTYYVAQSGSPAATPGDGTSCDAPDYVEDPAGSDHAAIQAAIDIANSFDTIYICPGTYEIGTTLNLGVDALTLEGDSAATTILDGGAVYVDGEYDSGGTQILTGETMTVSHLTFKNGFAEQGGAIGGDVEATSEITVGNSVFTSNYAGVGGAIAASTVTVNASSFDGNSALMFGGAIGAFTVTVTNSSFDGNNAGSADAPVAFGGAVYAAEATVTASSFNNNSTIGYGGAIISGELTVTTSSFDGNSAAGGGAVMSSTLDVSGSSFTNNSADVISDLPGEFGGLQFLGGAIVVGDLLGAPTTEATVASSHFSGNSATGLGADIWAAEGGTICGVEESSPGDWDPGDPAEGVWESACTAPPSVGTTYFVAQSGSPAATPGDGTSCAAPDYVELPAGSDHAAIQAAIDGAAIGDTIYICPGIYEIGTTLNLGGENIALQGESAATTILDGGAVYVDGSYMSGGTQILRNTLDVIAARLTFQNGRSTHVGGAVSAGNDAIITASTFVNNSADYGGAVYADNDASVTASSFTNNRSDSGDPLIPSVGGAVFSAASSSVIASVFSDNSAAGSGGAVYATTFGRSVSTTFTGNSATVAGGAMYAYVANLTDSSFVDNGAAPEYDVTIAIVGSGSVVDQGDPLALINCPDHCTELYTEGTTLLASPASVTWSGDDVYCDEATCTFVQAVTTPALTATSTSFDGAEYTITAEFSGSGGGGGNSSSHNLFVTVPRFGTITTPGGFSCEPTSVSCTLVAVQGGTVLLSSSTQAGYSLIRWDGCTSVSAGDCLVNLNADTTISATYGSSWTARFIRYSSTLRAGSVATVKRASSRLLSAGSNDVITITAYSKGAKGKAEARMKAIRKALRAAGVTAPIRVAVVVSEDSPAKRAKAVISVVWGVTP
jgi:predicted outer membrane repeat protein